MKEYSGHAPSATFEINDEFTTGSLFEVVPDIKEEPVRERVFVPLGQAAERADKYQDAKMAAANDAE